VGHNSVNHYKKNHKKTESTAAARDFSNSIRCTSGDADGDSVGMTLYKGDLTLKVEGHDPVYLEGNSLHRVHGKDDYVISDALLVSRVQELKKLFDKSVQEQEWKQTRLLALEIEKAPGTWVGNA